MSEYKNYLRRQLGLKEVHSKIDPHELAMGRDEEENEHGMSPDEADKTARDHLGEPEQAGYYSGVKVAKKMGMLKDMLQPSVPTTPRSLSPGGILSPTAVPTPVVALAIRGSNTGGLPSGADQTGVMPTTATGRLGGYEPIPDMKDNSKLVDKTPQNQEINSPAVKTENPTTMTDPHPHQTQKAAGEPPQAVTGASTDGANTLTLKSALPKGVDVDVAECGTEEQEEEEEGHMNDMDGEEDQEEQDQMRQQMNEGKHKAGCQCGFCKNKGSFGKKKKTEESKEEEEESKKLDETFSKHKKFAFDNMKMVGTLRTATVSENFGASQPFTTKWKMDKEKAGMVKIDETDTKESTEPPKKEGLVRLSEAFERMKGLANLGERRVLSNGLWEGISEPLPQGYISGKIEDDPQYQALLKRRNELVAYMHTAEANFSLDDRLRYKKMYDDLTKQIAALENKPKIKEHNDVLVPPQKNDMDAADKRFAKMEKDPTDRPFPFDKDHPELAPKVKQSFGGQHVADERMQKLAEYKKTLEEKSKRGALDECDMQRLDKINKVLKQ